MALGLYDVIAVPMIQTLKATEGVLAKGLAHAEAAGIDPASIVEARLAGDMLPFSFQLASVAQHSFGAIKGVMAGEFGPPKLPADATYAGLQALVAEARAGLEAFARADVDALEGRDVVFKLGTTSMPFEAVTFLTTFSMPNLHFHATTAYDILRMKGAPLGKRDYLGRLNMKT